MTPAAAPACPLCGGPGAPAFTVAGWAHHVCGRCGTWFVAPAPGADVLAPVYRSAAVEIGSRSCWECSARHAHATWRKALEDVRRLAGDGPLLDVGCGTGQFLAFARERGLQDLHGLELAGAAAAAARERSGAAVREGELLGTDLPRDAFAGVTLWDVIEHLPDPRGALRRVRELLRPGGVVALGTPSREGVSLRLLGRRARVVTPPEHLLYATPRGLAAALAAEGFELVRLETEQIRIRDWIPERGPCRPETSGTYARLYALLTGPAALAAQRALNALLRATRLGDQIVAVAQRP